MAGPGLMSAGRRLGEEPACSVMIVSLILMKPPTALWATMRKFIHQMFLQRSRAFTVYCAGLVSPNRPTCALTRAKPGCSQAGITQNSREADIGRASVRDTAVMQKSPQLRRRRY